jgi:hypothetical protein
MCNCLKTYVITYQEGKNARPRGTITIKAADLKSAQKFANKALRKKTFRIVSITEKP